MKINEMLTESQLDELKCWTGYKRVPGVPAGAPDSCRKATSEETEQLDELSPQTLARYKRAAGASAREADRAGDFEKGNKRFSGILRATKKEFDQATKKKPEQGVAEGLDQPREAGKAIQSLKNLALMKSTLTMQQLAQAGRESIVTNAINAAKTLEQSYMANKQQGNAIFVRALRDEIDNFRRGAPINASFPETDNPSELGELLQGKLGKINFQQGVAEGLGDTKTQVVGKYKGWRFEIETQTEDDRYVKYYGAVSPEGKWHSLPKRATADQFKQFVDSKGVTEGGVPSKYLSGTEKVDNISPVLKKPYGSARQTKLMKNFFGSS